MNDARGLRAGLPDSHALVGCDISLFGWDSQPGSLFGYLLAASTALQVLVLPLTGAIADRTQHKRRMLGLFTFIGAGATTLLALVTGTNWRLGVVLFIVATTGYYASVVIYYSVLPEIATADERDLVRSTLAAYTSAVREGASYQELNERHLAFHVSLVGLTGSPRLVAMADNLVIELKLALAQVDRIRRNAHDQAGTHAALVRLLEEERLDAAYEFLVGHLADAERDIVEALKLSGSLPD